MTAITQSSFAAGEISEELHGRVDQALYYIGLAKATNMVVQQTGGIYNRAGLRYIGNVKNHSQGARLLPFKFSSEDTYVLELGHRYMRFIRNDVHVGEGGKTITSIPQGVTTFVTITGHGYDTGDDVFISGVAGMREINQRWFRVVKVSANRFKIQSQVDGSEIDSSGYSAYASGGMSYKIYEIETPYEFHHLSQIKYAQSGDIITLVHPDYPPYELRRKGHTDWEIEKILFQKEGKYPVCWGINFSSLANSSSHAKHTYSFQVTGFNDEGQESAPGISLFGFDILSIAVQSNNKILVTCSLTTKVLPVPELLEPEYTDDGPTILTNDPATVEGSNNLTFPFLENGDTVYLGGLSSNINNQQFEIADVDSSAGSFTLTGITGHSGNIATSAAGYVYPTVTRIIKNAGKNFYVSFKVWYQEGISSYRGYGKVDDEENFLSLGSLSLPIFENSTSQDAHRWYYLSHATANIYINQNSSSATPAEYWPRIPGVSPPTTTLLFAAVNEYPSVVGFYQQRRVFGGTKNNPARLYYSKIGDYLAFAGETKLQKDDGPIVATLASGEVNNIKHLVSLSDLLALTDSTQWQIRANVGSAFTAKTLEQRPQTRVGSSFIAPIVFDDLIVYAREGNRSVIGIGYNNDREGYVTTEISLLSSHIFLRSFVTDIAALLVPTKQLVCVLNNGEVGHLTFNAEQKVKAWTSWRTKGLFESVSVARPSTSEGILDAAYFVVQRIVGGQVVRYIERTSDRQFKDVQDCYFVDAGLTYDNPTEITDITKGEATTITTAVAHNFEVGYEINFSDIQWVKKYDEFFEEILLAQLNNRKYKVKSVPSTTTFTLGDFDDNSDVDTSNFTQYINGGKVRKMIQTLYGLWYLEGEEVSILADGNVLLDLTVENGSIVLPHRYGRIHLGLRYISDIETLPLALEDPSAQTTPKSLADILVHLYRSGTLLLAQKGGSFYILPTRTSEVWGQPTELFTGKVLIPAFSQWEINGAFTLRQKDPLPMGVLSMLPIFGLGDAQ